MSREIKSASRSLRGTKLIPEVAIVEIVVAIEATAAATVAAIGATAEATMTGADLARTDLLRSVIRTGSNSLRSRPPSLNKRKLIRKRASLTDR